MANLCLNVLHSQTSFILDLMAVVHSSNRTSTTKKLAETRKWPRFERFVHVVPQTLCVSVSNLGFPFRHGGTWWFIPLSKWVITPVISGLSLLIPFITRVVGPTYDLWVVRHQVALVIISRLGFSMKSTSSELWGNPNCRQPDRSGSAKTHGQLQRDHVQLRTSQKQNIPTPELRSGTSPFSGWWFFATPLKNMSSSIGMIIEPQY